MSVRLLPSDVQGALIQVYGPNADCSRARELAEVLTLAVRNRIEIDKMKLFQPWKVGDLVRFAHQKQGEAKFTIKALLSRAHGAMVELEELPGEFAPSVFVAADYPDDSIVPRPPGAPARANAGKHVKH